MKQVVDHPLIKCYTKFESNRKKDTCSKDKFLINKLSIINESINLFLFLAEINVYVQQCVRPSCLQLQFFFCTQGMIRFKMHITAG